MNNEERAALANELAQPLQTLTSTLPLCVAALDRLVEIHARLGEQASPDAGDESEGDR
jgi:hypothetical protein